jgi:hypothetical protein
MLMAELAGSRVPLAVDAPPLPAHRDAVTDAIARLDQGEVVGVGAELAHA